MWDPQKMYSVLRDGNEEISVFGEIVVTDGDQTLFHNSEVRGRFPARSLLKPFQLLATGILPQELNPTLKNRYTACTGSISATKEQVEQLKLWYDDAKHEAQFSFLALPPSAPMDENYRVQLRLDGKPKEWIYHTCFSKHMGILEACEKNGWERETYHSATHPYHTKLIEVLSETLGENLTGVECVRDGCKLPSPVLSLLQMGKLYCSLAFAKSGDLHTIQQLMLSHPDWVGGPHRMDAGLMQANSGKVIAKEGADGLLGVAVLPSKQYPKGLGIVIKMAHGFQPKEAVIALKPILEILNLNTPVSDLGALEYRYHYEPFQKRNVVRDISPVISEDLSVWPEDTPYQRKVVFDVDKGHHFGLSSIESTVHLGSHTDAPNHFEKSAKGIGEVALNPYIGPAQVIEVRKARNSVIEIEDIQNIPIRANRVLFKTGSYPDPNNFNEDFIGLSASLIHYLGTQDVQLVGIDTPSIDPFESKTLDAHHATTQEGISILEGVVLNDIEPGLYRLSAIPLKLKGCDASPVRAILQPLSH